ncbi:hypothetical protein [Curtobacterium sp. 20TX0008]|uniref:hypothetical protein n=1 Tax=Curtobacterium sp. 20TX0008 TaxID=3022018 RepID=UPI00232DEC20|nr:hypothetical protein [Curtobacterium sp. 20TX0008]MDB6426580.1 hypothetical protein [Curtobacterium sp. 20TX0008]
MSAVVSSVTAPSTTGGRGTRPPATVSVLEVVVMCVVAVGLTIGSLLHKLQCAAPGVDFVTATRKACFADTVSLFSSRELASHVFPYVQPLGENGLPPGSLEYPTLSGIWAWLSALPVSSLHGFLVVTALTFVPVVVVTVVALARVAGRRAWFFAATPPLFLYALYNWDLLPVMCTVVAIAVAVWWPAGRSLVWRAVVVGALFGLGGAFKLYPLVFVAPFVLALLVDATASWGDRVRRALGAVAGSVGVVLVANLPFVLINAESWFSVIRYQGIRNIDGATLSVWYYAFQPWSAEDSPAFQHTLNLLATGATAVALLAVLVTGFVLGVRRGRMPWIETSAALLCAYLVANKVDSLQYALWLAPFFVFVRIRSGWVIAYLAANTLLFAGWFRHIYLQAIGTTVRTYADEAMSIGVWAQIVLLPILAVVFLRSRAVDRDDEVSVVHGAPEPQRTPTPSA